MGKWKISGSDSERTKSIEPSCEKQYAGKPRAKERQSSRSGGTEGELRGRMKGLDAFIL